MVGLQTLDLAIGVRVPASQPNRFKQLRAAQNLSRPFCVSTVTSRIFSLIMCRLCTFEDRLEMLLNDIHSN